MVVHLAVVITTLNTNAIERSGTHPRTGIAARGTANGFGIRKERQDYDNCQQQHKQFFFHFFVNLPNCPKAFLSSLLMSFRDSKRSFCFFSSVVNFLKVACCSAVRAFKREKACCRGLLTSLNWA